MSELGLPMRDRTNPPGPDRARRRRRSTLAVTLALVLVIGVAGVAFVGVRQVIGLFGTGPEDYPGPGTGEVQIEVAVGQTATAIARTLREQDVVASVAAFTAAARADERSTGIQPGFYRMRQQMPAADALAVLIDPAQRIQARVTVPEGLRVERVLDLLAEQTGLARADFDAALADPGTLGLPDYAQGKAEGFLFPATYDIPPGVDAPEVLRLMIRRFDQAAAQVDLDSGPLPAYELITLASLLEGEARLAEDFGRVSRVVYNRLDAGMALQFDSTISYALGENREVVTLADLEVDSPYNTYKITGLPPGPINSPGERALEMAKSPPPGDWLYFVTVDLESGETKFTDSYEEFLALKAELQAGR
jgi:UPF0755 protein